MVADLFGSVFSKIRTGTALVFRCPGGLVQTRIRVTSHVLPRQQTRSVNGISMVNVQFFRRRADIWIVKDGPVTNPFFANVGLLLKRFFDWGIQCLIRTI